jgi:hypothetical protein
MIMIQKRDLSDLETGSALKKDSKVTPFRRKDEDDTPIIPFPELEDGVDLQNFLIEKLLPLEIYMIPGKGIGKMGTKGFYPLIEAYVHPLRTTIIDHVPAHYGDKNEGIADKEIDVSFYSLDGQLRQDVCLSRRDMAGRTPQYVHHLENIGFPDLKKKEQITCLIDKISNIIKHHRAYNASGLLWDQKKQIPIFSNPQGSALTPNGFSSDYETRVAPAIQTIQASVQYGYKDLPSNNETAIQDYMCVLAGSENEIIPANPAPTLALLSQLTYGPLSSISPAPNIILTGPTGVFKTAISRVFLQADALNVSGQDGDVTSNLRDGGDTAYALDQITYYYAGMLQIMDDGAKKKMDTKKIQTFYTNLSRLGASAAMATGKHRGRWGESGEGGMARTFFPRGPMVWTCESLHLNSMSDQSTLGRYALFELHRGEVDQEGLTTYQGVDKAASMNRWKAAYIIWLLNRIEAPTGDQKRQIDEKILFLSSAYRTIGMHPRAAHDSWAKIEYGLNLFLDYGVSIGAITNTDKEAYADLWHSVLIEAAKTQIKVMQTSESNDTDNPSDIFLEYVRKLFQEKAIFASASQRNSCNGFTTPKIPSNLPDGIGPLDLGWVLDEKSIPPILLSPTRGIEIGACYNAGNYKYELRIPTKRFKELHQLVGDRASKDGIGIESPSLLLEAMEKKRACTYRDKKHSMKLWERIEGLSDTPSVGTGYVLNLSALFISEDPDTEETEPTPPPPPKQPDPPPYKVESVMLPISYASVPDSNDNSSAASVPASDTEKDIKGIKNMKNIHAVITKEGLLDKEGIHPCDLDLCSIISLAVDRGYRVLWSTVEFTDGFFSENDNRWKIRITNSQEKLSTAIIDRDKTDQVKVPYNGLTIHLNLDRWNIDPEVDPHDIDFAVRCFDYALGIQGENISRTSPGNLGKTLLGTMTISNHKRSTWLKPLSEKALHGTPWPLEVAPHHVNRNPASGLYIHTYDKNAAYWSACVSRTFGTGDPIVCDASVYTDKTYGIWCVSATPPNNDDNMLPPFSTVTGKVIRLWAYTPQVALAKKLGWNVEIHEGYVWDETHEIFEEWAKRLFDARQKARSYNSEIAASMIKAVFTRARGIFAKGITSDTKPEWERRPDWSGVMCSESYLRMGLKINQIEEKTPGYLAVSTDCIYWISDNPDPLTALPLKIGSGLGEFKHQGSITDPDVVKAIIEAARTGKNHNVIMDMIDQGIGE